MLETIREFAVEQLESSGDADEVRRRHADHFLALAEEAERVTGPNLDHVDEWAPRLEAEMDNLRAALDRLTAPEHAELAQQLAGALWKHWYMTGSVGEGMNRLSAALAYDTPPTAHRARALNGGTAMALETGDQPTGRRWADEALEIARMLGDPFDIAHAEFLLANVEAGAENWAAARELLERSRDAFWRLRPNGHYALLSTRVLSWVSSAMGEGGLAQELAEQNLRDARAAGNTRVEAMTLGQLASRAIDDGRLSEAAPLVRDSYRLKRQRGDQISVAGDLLTIARLLAYADRPTDAAQVLSRSSALYDELGAAVPRYDIADIEKVIGRIKAALSDAEYAQAQEAGRSLTDEDIDAIVDDAVARLT